MKTSNIFLTLLIAASVFTGCVKEYVEPDLMDFNISETELYSEGEELSGSIEISTTAATMWRIRPVEAQNWFTVSTVKGKGSATIDYAVQENLDLEMRTAEFVVKGFLNGDNYYTDTLRVTQMPFDPFIEIDTHTLETCSSAPYYGAHLEMLIRSNLDWTVTLMQSKNNEAAVDWATVDVTEGSKKQLVGFDIAPNALSESRNACLKLQSVDGEKVLFVDINQNSYSPMDVNDLIIHIPGMTGYLPEGDGVLSVVDVMSGQEKQIPVTVSYTDGAAQLKCRETVVSSNYLFTSFQTSDGKALRFTRNQALIVIPTDQEVSADGWSDVFWSFSGTSEEDPIILNSETIWNLATSVNEGVTYENVWFALDGPIDLGGKAWTTIGNHKDTPFMGHMDGRGNVISGFNQVSDVSYNGLFGLVQGADADHPASLSNIILKGTDAAENDLEIKNANATYTGAICGVATNHVHIKGCKNYLNILAGSYSGGIAGALGCMTSEKYPLIGAAERPDVTIEDCHNYGRITMIQTSYNVGGVTGTSKIKVYRCSNAGNVHANGGNIHMGGIVGYNDGYVEECYNMGQISGNGNFCSGIVGIGAAEETYIINCYNTGYIQVNNDNAAGICGGVPGLKSAVLHMRRCYNIGLTASKKGSLYGIMQKAAKYPFQFCCAGPVKPHTNGWHDCVNEDELHLDWAERYHQGPYEDLKHKAKFTTTYWSQQHKVLPGWDFENVWGIDEGTSTPYLIHNEQLPHPTK